MDILAVVTGIIGIILGMGIGYFIRKYVTEAKIVSAEEAAKKILIEAEEKAQTLQKEKVLEAKEEVHRLRNELEKEIKDRRAEVQRMERRILQKEESLDKKAYQLEKKEDEIKKREEEIVAIREKLTDTYKKQLMELERISGLSTEEQKKLF